MAELPDRLRAATPARLNLGRAGAALPTRALLDFEIDHARARDAVWASFDAEGLGDALGQAVIVVRSRAEDRAEYLRRPDLGRRLHPGDLECLELGGYDLSIIAGDGLSPSGVHAHAASMVLAIGQRLPDWSLAPTVVAHQARVALGDEIGAALGAKLVCVLIGERPGLSSPDSLGAYLTWAPRIGCEDSARNCISNIRPPHGLAYEDAADTIVRLLRAARRTELTGVKLKDGPEALEPPGT
jgi:ethanolamine ammonia-lyase small subunit